VTASRALIRGALFAQLLLYLTFYQLSILVNTSDGWRFVGDIYTLDNFREVAMDKVWRSVYIGIILFCSAVSVLFEFGKFCKQLNFKPNKHKNIHAQNLQINFQAIQINCFLRVCENMMDKIRKAFFKAVMRQDIGW
jgi:hypothetical protein